MEQCLTCGQVLDDYSLRKYAETCHMIWDKVNTAPMAFPIEVARICFDQVVNEELLND